MAFGDYIYPNSDTGYLTSNFNLLIDGHIDFKIKDNVAFSVLGDYYMKLFAFDKATKDLFYTVYLFSKPIHITSMYSPILFIDNDYIWVYTQVIISGSDNTAKVYKINLSTHSIESSTSLTSATQNTFSCPTNASYKNKNTIFITDRCQNKLAIFDLDTLTITSQVGSYGTGDYEFKNPSGCDYINGKVYVADRGNKRISIYSDTLSCLGHITVSEYIQDVSANNFSIIATEDYYPADNRSYLLECYDINDYLLKHSKRIVGGTHSYTSNPPTGSARLDVTDTRVYILNKGTSYNIYKAVLNGAVYPAYSSLNLHLETDINSFSVNCKMPLKPIPDMFSPNLNLTPSLLEANLNSFNIKENIVLGVQVSGYNERISSSSNIPFDIDIILQQEGLPHLTMPLDIDIGINVMDTTFPLTVSSQINTVNEIDFTFDMSGKLSPSVELNFEPIDIGDSFNISGTLGIIWNTADLVIKSDNDLFHNTQFSISGRAYTKAEYSTDLLLDFTLKSLANNSYNIFNSKIPLTISGAVIGDSNQILNTESIDLDLFLFGVISDGYIHC